MTTEADLVRDIADVFGGTQRLADLLNVSRRNVLRYANGDQWTPAGLWGQMDQLLARRVDEIVALRAEVARARAGAEEVLRRRAAERGEV